MSLRKIVLITGCSSGLGKFLAENLVGEEFIVYAGIRKLSETEGLPTEITHKIHLIQLDITKTNSIYDAIRTILKNEKKIDVLINNAGFTLAGPAIKNSVDEFQKLLDTNLLGAFQMMQAVYPAMRSHGGGKIINITSLNGLVALPNFALYSASKFALQALSNAMKYEVQKENIWITALAAGALQRVESEQRKPLPHKTAREKFFLLKLLMPMVTQETLLKSIKNVIRSSHPPSTIILGEDAHITIFLQRFLPRFLWERLLFFIWSK